MHLQAFDKRTRGLNLGKKDVAACGGSDMLHSLFAMKGEGEIASNFRRRVTAEATTTLNSIPYSAGCPVFLELESERAGF